MPLGAGERRYLHAPDRGRRRPRQQPHCSRPCRQRASCIRANPSGPSPSARRHRRPRRPARGRRRRGRRWTRWLWKRGRRACCGRPWPGAASGRSARHAAARGVVSTAARGRPACENVWTAAKKKPSGRGDWRVAAAKGGQRASSGGATRVRVPRAPSPQSRPKLVRPARQARDSAHENVQVWRGAAGAVRTMRPPTGW